MDACLQIKVLSKCGKSGPNEENGKSCHDEKSRQNGENGELSLNGHRFEVLKRGIEESINEEASLIELIVVL